MTDETSPHHSSMTKTDGNLKFAFMMVAFLLLAWVLQNNQHRQDSLIDTQNAVVMELRSGTINDCAAHNATTAKMNALIDELVTSVRQGTSLPPGEQADRIARYTALKADPQICPKP